MYLRNETLLVFVSKEKSKSRKYQGKSEKSSIDMTSSRNMISTSGAQASPKMEGRNQMSGKVSVSCCYAKPVANAPWNPLMIRGRLKSVSRS